MTRSSHVAESCSIGRGRASASPSARELLRAAPPPLHRWWAGRWACHPPSWPSPACSHNVHARSSPEGRRCGGRHRPRSRQSTAAHGIRSGHHMRHPGVPRQQIGTYHTGACASIANAGVGALGKRVGGRVACWHVDPGSASGADTQRAVGRFVRGNVRRTAPPVMACARAGCINAHAMVGAVVFAHG